MSKENINFRVTDMVEMLADQKLHDPIITIFVNDVKEFIERLNIKTISDNIDENNLFLGVEMKSMKCLESDQFAFETKDKIYYPIERNGKKYFGGIDKSRRLKPTHFSIEP